MNPRLQEILDQANQVMNNEAYDDSYRGPMHVGVDLGTAYTVLVVLDENMMPLAGAYRFAEVIRDGLVVDFMGAIQLVRKLKAQVEEQLGRELYSAATGYPSGVYEVDARAQGNVLYGAGLECTRLVDEATAASTLLQIGDGAVVDVGGGTTGIAIVENGEVVYTANEPTGGTHFTLVIAGALKIPFMEAERLKIDPAQQPELFPLVKPVMEKVGTIIARHIAPYHVKIVYMVGGTSKFMGIDEVVQEVIGVKTVIPGEPLFVTPIGIAMHN